jgi:hypothetical protein
MLKEIRKKQEAEIPKVLIKGIFKAFKESVIKALDETEEKWLQDYSKVKS